MEVRDNILTMVPQELAAWVEPNVQIDGFSFKAAFAVENIDGQAFCCLSSEDLENIFPLLGHRYKFQNWYRGLHLPHVSLISQLDTGKDVTSLDTKEFSQLVGLVCPSIAKCLSDQKIDGKTFLEMPTGDMTMLFQSVGDIAKGRRLQEECVAMMSKGKRPTKKKAKVSREKRRQYRLNRGSKYVATWIGPDTAKLYPTGWKDGKKIFYRQKRYSPKKRPGSSTPPHFWDLDFPDYTIPIVEARKSPPPGSYGARRRAKFRARFLKKNSSDNKTSTS